MHILIALFLFLSLISGFCSAQSSCVETGHLANCPTQLSVTIYNSYSGSILRDSQSGVVLSGTTLRTNLSQVSATIQASAASSFSSSGNITAFSGMNTTSGGYTIHYPIPLALQDQGYTRQLEFLKNGFEPYMSNTLYIEKDTTAPSIPNLLGPAPNTVIQTTTIDLDRSPSIDTGIGLSHYYVSLSLLPNMAGSLRFYATTDEIHFLSSQLPLGTLYRQVEAVDYLGNTSVSPIHYFHNQTPSIKGSQSSSGNGSSGTPSTTSSSNGSNTQGNSGPPKNKDNSTLLIMNDRSFHWLDEDLYDGNHAIERGIAKQILEERFHESPGSDQRTLPKALPKTGGWGKQSPDPCIYESCDKISHISWFWFYGVVLCLLYIGKRFKKYHQKFDKA